MGNIIKTTAIDIRHQDVERVHEILDEAGFTQEAVGGGFVQYVADHHLPLEEKVELLQKVREAIFPLEALIEDEYDEDEE